MTTLKTSEWVSPGHPDKIADGISEYILDRIIEIDPKARYALEVQIKDEQVSLAGEVTTSADVCIGDYQHWAKEAVAAIGYTEEYKKRWNKSDTICDKELVVISNVSRQSPNIAQGVDKDAWGDQGIFFGYYCRETEDGMGIDYYLAKKLGRHLYGLALSGKQPIGLDIKTQVTVQLEEKGEYEVKEVVVAVPTIESLIDEKQTKKLVKAVIKEVIPEADGAKLTVNGTGAYHIHGPVGDSGTTGRKLVVDFYGSRSRIGGGSPWTKDGSKADLTLNLFAYLIAKQYYNDLKNEISGLHHVETEMSCCIGKRFVRCFVTAYDENGVPCYQTIEEENIRPSSLIKIFGLNKPNYFNLCQNGLFSCVK